MTVISLITDLYQDMRRMQNENENENGNEPAAAERMSRGKKLIYDICRFNKTGKV